MGSVFPNTRERIEEILVGIADPQAGLGREPIEPLQPQRRRVQTFAVQNFRAPILFWGRSFALPFVAVPEPDALVALTLGEEAQANGVVGELEHKLGLGGMRQEQFVPIDGFAGGGMPQMGEETMAQALDRNFRLRQPFVEEAERWGFAQQIEIAVVQHEHRPAAKELHLLKPMHCAVRQPELLRESQLFLGRFHQRHQFRERPIEQDGVRRARQFKPLLVTPADEPLQQIKPLDREGIAL